MSSRIVGWMFAMSSVGALAAGGCATTETTTQTTERIEPTKHARRSTSAASLERRSEAAARRSAAASESEAERKPDPAHPVDPTSPVAASPEASQVASEEGASYVAEIQFTPGSAVVDADNQVKITRLVDKARGAGRIDDIKVVAWSDEEYPSTQTQALSLPERTLAADRGKEVKKFLLTLEHTVPMQIYNMAERPNTFAQIAGTDNARIKKTLEAASASKKAATAMIMLIVH